MHAMEAIRIALKFSDMGIGMFSDMRDAAFVRPGPWGGNHAMWIAGHLAVVEGRLHQMIHGTDNPLRQWKSLFDWGSESVDDPAAYPPFDKVVQALKDMRARTHAFLDEFGEAGLDRPTKSRPPGFGGPAFETAGSAIMVIAGHACGHLGGLTVVRAAAGKQRMFVPSDELKNY